MAGKTITVAVPESLVRRAEAHWPELRALPAVQSLAPRETAAGAVRVALFLALEKLDAQAGEPGAADSANDTVAVAEPEAK